MTDADAQPKKKKIWGWALLAGWIAAALAVLGCIGAYVNAPAPDGTPDSTNGELANLMGYCAAAAVLAGVVVWAIFFVAVFMRRGSIAKSLAVLAIMIVSSFAVATPISFVAMVGHATERRENIEAWNREESQRVRIMAQALDREIMAAGDLSVTSLQRPSDIDDILARNARVLALYEAYKAQLTAEIDHARQATADLGLTTAEREALLVEVERRIFADLIVGADLDIEAARQRTDIVTTLHSTKERWTVQGGHIAFYDTALMEHVNALAQEYDAIVVRINERNARRAGSAPPPPQ